MSLVENRPPEADVITKQPSQVLAVPRAASDAGLRDDPAFEGRSLQALASLLSDHPRSRLRSLQASGDPSNRGRLEASVRLLPISWPPTMPRWRRLSIKRKPIGISMREIHLGKRNSAQTGRWSDAREASAL
jgi:hypothetical protein